MANQQEIEALYDWLDLFHESRLGRYADLSAAFFDGDFRKSLRQAQKDKHDWVLDGVGIKGPGKRILDVGCGWGPILNAVRERGVTGVGLTLSRAYSIGRVTGFGVTLTFAKASSRPLAFASDRVSSPL